MSLEGLRRSAGEVAAACLRLEPTFRVHVVHQGAGTDICPNRPERVVWSISFRRAGKTFEQTIDITDEDVDPEMFARTKLLALSTCLKGLKQESSS